MAEEYSWAITHRWRGGHAAADHVAVCWREIGLQLDSAVYIHTHIYLATCALNSDLRKLRALSFICPVYSTSNTSSNCVRKLGTMFWWTLNSCMLNLDWVVWLLATRVGGEKCSNPLSRTTRHAFPIAVFKLCSGDSKPMFRAKSPTLMFLPQINYDYDAS